MGGVGNARTATLEPERLVEETIHAAGGIVVRRSMEGWWDVALVHRPAREDWTFPKGKLEPGETFEQCAYREVLEETGLHCRLGRFVGHTEYRDRKDRRKVVAYWVMEALSGQFVVSEEVDEMRWVDLSEASQLLTYERDRELLVVLVAADEEVAPLI